ncbi:MAG TPA: histidine kinase, partial [Flavipsychrobacter sp.]|nr:histidine kinase [Flavipsychrobacter sp.]
MNDSYIIPLLVAGSILIPMFMFYITTFVIISKNKERRSEAEKRQMEFRYEKQLLQAMLEVQEKAMNQISQEIHDNIGQVLASVHMNIISLSKGLVTDTDQVLADSKEQVATALKDLRNLSHVLNSRYINKI